MARSRENPNFQSLTQFSPNKAPYGQSQFTKQSQLSKTQYLSPANYQTPSNYPYRHTEEDEITSQEQSIQSQSCQQQKYFKGKYYKLKQKAGEQTAQISKYKTEIKEINNEIDKLTFIFDYNEDKYASDEKDLNSKARRKQHIVPVWQILLAIVAFLILGSQISLL